MAESCIIYGDSGSTKTSQIVHFAKYVYETTGKQTRVITGDGGGCKPIEDSGLIEAKVIEVFDYTNRVYPLADLRRLSKGWWPGIYERDGKKYRGLIETPKAAWEKVGAYAIEGLESISSLLLMHASNQTDKVIFENAKFEEDGETFGTNNQGHYGLVQKEIYTTVMNFKGLPVEHVLWTSLIGRGEDKRTRETVYGPKLAGDAKTAIAPSWFGSCLHLHVYTSEKTEEGTGIKTYDNHPVAFFVKHPDEVTGVPYLAKPRCTPSEFPSLQKLFPNGYISLNTDSGVENYFRALDRLKVAGKKRAQTWKEEVDKRRAQSNGVGEHKASGEETVSPAASA